MNRCPHCRRDLPDDAAYCIYCAAQLRPAPPNGPQEPATGATIRLNPLDISAPMQPPQHHSTAVKRHKHHARHRRQAALGPVFLIGILFLLMTHTFFPGILVLLGLLGFMRAAGYGRPRRALKQLIFLGGMALVFWSGRFWPGIILVIFASHLVSGSRYGWRP